MVAWLLGPLCKAQEDYFQGDNIDAQVSAVMEK